MSEPAAQAAYAAPKPHLFVAAGVILRADGHVLLAQRPQGKSWAGWWELPGGKIEAGETDHQALVRELHEELGIRVTHATPWLRTVYAYEENVAHLHFWRVTAWEGEATGQENQALAWVDVRAEALAVAPLLPATVAPLRWMRLPERYRLTSIGGMRHLPAYIQQLDNWLAHSGRALVQLREPAWQQRDAQGLYQAFTQVLACCRRHGAYCLVNSVHPQGWWHEADGVHFRAADARAWIDSAQARPQGLVGVSAHHAEELATARALGADFAVLGHVLDTPSHPGQAGMGWQAFACATRDAGLPVYALGGQGEDTLACAQTHGAHGVAGIHRWTQL